MTDTTACPECGGTVEFDSVMVGELLPCPDCGAELEVVTDDPVTFDLAPELEEDWGE